jgi:triosephosphate isomerase (TIM)
MSTKIIVANWKMNPETLAEAESIASTINKQSKKFGSTRLVVCPPFLYLTGVAKIFAKNKKIYLGSQDVFIGTGGAHTGEISADMLKSVGVKYVIVGHSERRESLDTNQIVREKLFGARKDGFKVILCIGEKVRDEHGKQYEFVREELENALAKLPKASIKNLIVAYEPIWAIGKSEKEAMQPEALQEMAVFIKRVMSDLLGIKNAENIPILYGGSVTKNNAKEIITKGAVDGLLIGRESLKTGHFVELIEGIK